MIGEEKIVNYILWVSLFEVLIGCLGVFMVDCVMVILGIGII